MVYVETSPSPLEYASPEDADAGAVALADVLQALAEDDLTDR
jgi:hypothetical protein